MRYSSEASVWAQLFQELVANSDWTTRLTTAFDAPSGATPLASSPVIMGNDDWLLPSVSLAGFARSGLTAFAPTSVEFAPTARPDTARTNEDEPVSWSYDLPDVPAQERGASGIAMPTGVLAGLGIGLGGSGLTGVVSDSGDFTLSFGDFQMKIVSAMPSAQTFGALSNDLLCS